MARIQDNREMSATRRLLVQDIAGGGVAGQRMLDSGIPYIPCKYNGQIASGQIYPMGHPIKGVFNGLKWVEDGAGQAMEVVQNFVLYHNVRDGRCLIPDTDENRAVLAKCIVDAK